MAFDPNQPFTVEDQGFDMSKPFTVEGSEGSPTPAPVPARPQAMTNLRTRDNLSDLAPDEVAVDQQGNQALADEILAASKGSGKPEDIANVLAGKYGISPKNISWYIENFRNGKYKGPVNFAAPQSQGIVVQGKPEEKTAAEKTLGPVNDVIQGAREGYGEVQSDIGSALLHGLNALGADFDVEEAKKVLGEDWSDQYSTPNGYARSIGKFVGETVPQLPLFEVAPFAAEGRVGDIVNNAVQGAASGALMSGGNPETIGEDTALGGLLGGGISAGLNTVGALSEAFAGRLRDALRAGDKKLYNDLVAEKDAFLKARAEQPEQPLEASLADEANAFLERKPATEPTKEDLINGLSKSEPVEVPEGKISVQEKPSAKAIRDSHATDVINRAKEITDTMASDIDVNVITSRRNLTKAQREQLKADGIDPKNAQAWVSSDGRVHVIAENVKPDEVSGVIFHEVLGHKGLAMAFREDLDNVLSEVYEKNWKVRQEADDFIKKTGLYTGPDQIIRAVEEVLAGRSEAGRVDLTTWEKVKNSVRGFGRKIGLDLRYTDSEVKAILKQGHDAVINGSDAVTSSGNRYSLKSYRQETPHQGQFREAATEDQKYTVSHEEVLADMEDNGLTPGKAMRKAMRIDPTLGPKAVVAYRKAIDAITKVQGKILDGTATGKEEAEFAYRLSQAVDLVQKVEAYKSDIGRALNFLKLVADGKEGSVPKDLLNDNLISKITTPDGHIDRDALYRIANQMKVASEIGPQAEAKLLSDMTKPLPEDYLTSLHYAFMLSGLGTHAKNAIGNASLLMADNLAYTAASPVEGLARWWGTLKAVADSQTRKDVVESWREGRPHHQVNKHEGGVILPSFLSFPMRGLAASDSFFRSLIQSADFNGMAYRLAKEEGLSGAKLWDRVDELLRNPTQEMIGRADKKASRLQLVDTPGGIGQLMEVMKARPKDDSMYGKRAMRFIAQNLVPFTRVATNAFSTAVTWSPLGMLTKAGRDALEGGVEARTQFARMAMGSAVLGYFAMMYADGRLRIDPVTSAPEVKTSKGWMSLQGLDSVSIHAATVAQIGDVTNRYKDPSAYRMMASALQGMVTAMTSSTFGDQLKQLFDATTPDQKGMGAFDRAVINQASSWVPAASRQAAGVLDEYQRDTSGMGTGSDKLYGRLASAVPGQREVFPIRHDRFGNELPSTTTISGVFNTSPLNSPAEEEVIRLEKATGKTLVSPVLPGQIKETPAADVRQNFQKEVGKRTMSLVSEWVASPEWKTMSDTEKAAVVQKIARAIRKEVRKETFGGK